MLEAAAVLAALVPVILWALGRWRPAPVLIAEEEVRRTPREMELEEENEVLLDALTHQRQLFQRCSSERLRLKWDYDRLTGELEQAKEAGRG